MLREAQGSVTDRGRDRSSDRWTDRLIAKLQFQQTWWKHDDFMNIQYFYCLVTNTCWYAGQKCMANGHAKPCCRCGRLRWRDLVNERVRERSIRDMPPHLKTYHRHVNGGVSEKAGYRNPPASNNTHKHTFPFKISHASPSRSWQDAFDWEMTGILFILAQTVSQSSFYHLSVE